MQVEQQTNLKKMRLFMGLKQRDLASRAGVAPPVVNSLERKGIYDTRTAVKYAKALNCNPLFLLEGLSIT